MDILQNAIIKPHIVESLGEPVGKIWKQLQTHHTSDGEFLVASPLSRTPLPIYAWLLENAQTIPHWDKVKFVFMDEQVGEANGKQQYLSVDNPASFEGFARKHFLHPLSEKVSIPEGEMILKPDLEDFPAFDEKLEKHGGLDLLILAIGEEGHYALVMPGTPFEEGYHATHISPKVVTQHVGKSGPYQGSSFGNQGISLGPKQVVGAKNIVVIISGENKRELTKQLFSYHSFDPKFPMSIIFHPDLKTKVQIFLTQDVLGTE
ncbi:MAG TPA: 6-phosphogluconolactonase [Candidatus Saccharimonadales bacterium]|nr:6-phosphogluconolactonase [Candidatus Saccharimonadales bacterium]